MDAQKVLESLGFTANESKIYMTLLHLGVSSPTVLAKKCDLHRTNVYDALTSLQEKGFCTAITIDDKKQYEASPPEALNNLIVDRELIIKKVIDQYEHADRLDVHQSEVKISEGLSAVKDLYNHFNDISQDRLTLGVPKIEIEKLGAYLQEYHEARAAKKIGLKAIYNTEIKKRAMEINEMPFAEARVLPEEYDSPVEISICGDEVAFIYWSNIPLIIHIKNPEMAKTNRNYFNILWGLAER